MYDLIILGGGPAGSTAAVYAARKQLNTLLLSKDLGGQINLTLGIENYMGFQFIEGPELIQKFETQMKQFPIDVKVGPTATAVSQKDDGLEVVSDNGQVYQAKAVIIATGKRSRPLEALGTERLVGKGVSYCAVCDGPSFADQNVAVVGGGNSAMEAVNDMLKIAGHVYVIARTSFTSDPVLYERAKSATNVTPFTEHQVLEIKGMNSVEGISIKSLATGEVRDLSVEGVFIEIGLIPNSDAAKGIAELNSLGEIKVNTHCETGIPGLYAAGDVTNAPEKQIVVAAGEGAKAALQAHRYLQRLG